MDFDLAKASKKLCALDFNYIYDGLSINVIWFRAMALTGDWLIGRHMHSSYEFHFIKEGSCEVITDTDHFTVHEGEFYLTAPSILHEQRSINSKHFIEYCLNCDLKLIEDSSTEILKLGLILNNSQCAAYPDNEDVSCIKLFEYALREACCEYTGFFGNIKNIIPLIINNAARKMSESRIIDYAVPKKSNSNNFRMLQMERFIEDNISTPISTSSLSSYMHLSQKQVCRIIKHAKNMSTKEFINSIKLTKAKELLKSPNLHVKKVADMLGFSSEYYFSQFFKKLEGYPPVQYRNNIQNG